MASSLCTRSNLSPAAAALHVCDVHTVASFYPHFRLKPPVPVDVRVCDDMTCHLNQSYNLRVALEGKYAHLPDVVRVRDISCVGRCDAAPVVAINDRYYDGVSLAAASQLIDREMAPHDPAGRPRRGARRSSPQRPAARYVDPVRPLPG